jgi:hypothetical protein
MGRNPPGARHWAAPRVGREQFALGVRRFVVGLAKKVLIANTLAVPVDAIFALPPEQLGPATAWLAVVCYTLQIYFDFSGYSDMAIGLAHMLGFRFRENFAYPYVAQSIREFWRRWHISLSTWFRDYPSSRSAGAAAPRRASTSISSPSSSSAASGTARAGRSSRGVSGTARSRSSSGSVSARCSRAPGGPFATATCASS